MQYQQGQLATFPLMLSIIWIIIVLIANVTILFLWVPIGSIDPANRVVVLAITAMFHFISASQVLTGWNIWHNQLRTSPYRGLTA
jgi:hypothetical protein